MIPSESDRRTALVAACLFAVAAWCSAASAQSTGAAAPVASPVAPVAVPPPAASPLAYVPSGPLTLGAAVAAMEANNRAIRAARLAAEAARTEITRADVSPNPTLQAQLSNTTVNRYPWGQTDRLVRLEQLVERGRKRELRTDAAKAGAEAARLDVADTVRQQRAAVVGAWHDLAAAQRQVAIATENVQGYQRLIAASERRLSAGDIAQVDVSRLRIEATRAANDLRAAEGARREAQVSLALALGAEQAAAQLVATDADLAGRDDIAQGVARARRTARDDLQAAIDRRADVLAARARVANALKVRDLAASQRTRDVSIGVQAERNPGFGGTVFALSATIPLFINNDFSGDIARASADLASARDDAERVQAVVRADLERALGQLETAADRAQRLLGDALPEAQRVAQAIEFAFNNGAVQLTDLFDTRRQLAALRADAVQAQADYGRALAAWQAALAPEPLDGAPSQ